MESKVEDVNMSQFLRNAGPMPQTSEIDVFGGLTVGQVVGPGLGPKLSLQTTVRAAAATLADLGRTAVAVSDGYGSLAGLITENDIMRCYFEEAPADRALSEWLAGGMARAPATVLQRLSVEPSHTLAEVAERMVQNALAGDCACHHVLVEEDPESLDGRCAVLSALDMVHAFCRPELWNCSVLTQQGAVLKDPHPQSQGAQHLTVADIMKPKDCVFTCLPCETIRDVLRVLLMSHQNSVLIVDEEGVYGLFTPRDAVRAYSEGVPPSVKIADWLRGLNAGVNSRIVPSDATIAEAAALMTARGVNHLVVVPTAGVQALGVVSSFDLAVCACGARAPTALQTILTNAPHDAGPTVGELVKQQWHMAAICNRGATLAEVATLLAASGRTSLAVSLGGDSPPLGLLTEMDILRAYVDGWEREFTVERWLLIQESSRPALLPHLIVPPSVRVTEAAELMLGAARPCQDPCHHLVVKGTGFGWEGVFSALDVARALCGLKSGLEVACTGADQLRVSMVMKPVDSVPVIKASDSLKDAISLILRARQAALLVVDDQGAHFGLLTPRCGLLAFAKGAPHDTSVGDWLRHTVAIDGGLPREVSPDALLLDAAVTMTEHCVHHLVVKLPGPSPAVGVLSSLDLARGVASVRCHAPFASLGWLAACRGPPTCALWAA
mmetsp:Transcript_126186/g.365212  ORF Transcript_126186/g.365212 Transcript_126186/m.365212 type:complete len:668 (+) Transcript_126186:51-2054(+)